MKEGVSSHLTLFFLAAVAHRYASPYFSVFFAGFVNWLLQLLLSCT